MRLKRNGADAEQKGDKIRWLKQSLCTANRADYSGQGEGVSFAKGRYF